VRWRLAFGAGGAIHLRSLSTARNLQRWRTPPRATSVNLRAEVCAASALLLQEGAGGGVNLRTGGLGSARSCIRGAPG
jgi:hypothetical protein